MRKYDKTTKTLAEFRLWILEKIHTRVATDADIQTGIIDQKDFSRNTTYEIKMIYLQRFDWYHYILIYF